MFSPKNNGFTEKLLQAVREAVAKGPTPRNPAEIEEAQKKYGHCIVFKDAELADVSNWLHGSLEYWKDYEYLVDYENNHYIFFQKVEDLNWFILSNNLTSYKVYI